MPPNQIRVRPRSKDFIVRDPKTRQALPAEGALVECNAYWIRRLRDGDVVLANSKKGAK